MTEPQVAVWRGHRTYPVRRIGLAAIIAVAVAALAYILDDALLWAAYLAADGASDDAVLLSVERIMRSWLWVLLPTQLAALVPTIIWMRRARLNLDAFPDARPTLGVGWAVAGWLVPIANLVVPGRMMAGIARDSVRSTAVSAAVWVWWVALVTLNLGFRLTGVRGLDSELALTEESDLSLWAEHYRSWAVNELWPVLTGVVAAACFAFVVTRVSAAQEERIARAAPAA
jgi:hypothetical protein